MQTATTTSRGAALALGARSQRPSVARSVCATATQKYEIRICNNTSCKQQKSEQMLKFAQDLRLPGVDVIECGCLGHCGSGPNMAILPEGGQGEIKNHMDTPAIYTEFCMNELGITVSDATIKATDLRLEGNKLVEAEDLAGGIAKYTEAIELEPEQGLQFLYSNRSAAYLTLGDLENALDDARAAVDAEPSWLTAHIRVIDVAYALKDVEMCREAFYDCLDNVPSFPSEPEYEPIRQALGIRRDPNAF